MSENGRPALSPRERQLLKFAAAGLTDSAIAVRLGISEATVKTYWRRTRLKLGGTSRTELVATALKSEIEKTFCALRAERASNGASVVAHCDYYRTLLEQAPDAILVVKADGHIEMLNESAADLFGWTVEDLQDRHLAELVPDLYRPAHREHVADYFQNPSKRAMGDHIATSARHKSGREVPIAANLSAVGEGHDMSVICVVRPAQLPK